MNDVHRFKACKKFQVRGDTAIIYFVSEHCRVTAVMNKAAMTNKASMKNCATLNVLRLLCHFLNSVFFFFPGDFVLKNRPYIHMICRIYVDSPCALSIRHLISTRIDKSKKLHLNFRLEVEGEEEGEEALCPWWFHAFHSPIASFK